MITVYYLARGLSRRVSYSLLARGLRISFSLDQSHNSQWLKNTLLVNPSDAQHVKSHQRKILTFFTPSCRDGFPDEKFAQPAIAKQRAVETEKGSPCPHRASSASVYPILPSSALDLELEIRLTEA